MSPTAVAALLFSGSLALTTLLGCSGDDDSPGGSGGKTSSGGGTSANGGSSSSNGGSSNASGGSSSAACPNLAGNWTVSKHCQPGQVGSSVAVNQTGCTASVPTYSFSGTVGANGELNFSGMGITCTGTATATTITEMCLVLGTNCAVTLTR